MNSATGLPEMLIGIAADQASDQFRVGIGADDSGPVSAHFPFDAGAVFVCCPKDALSHPRRSGKGYESNPRMLGDEFSGQFTASRQHVDHPGRETGFLGQFGQVKRA